MRRRRPAEAVNSGLNVTGSGNQVNTGSVGGDMHQVHTYGTGKEAALLTAQTTLTQLSAALNTHADQVHSITSCRQAVNRLDEELNSPSPDGRRLTETLEMLTLAIGAVPPVLSIVSTFRDVIESLMS